MAAPTPIIQVPMLNAPLASATADGAMPAAAVVKLSKMDQLVTGTALTDASATIQPATDKCSRYEIPAATRTTNRTTTLGVTSGITGLNVLMVDSDLSANTWTIANGGTNGGNVGVFPTSHAKRMGMWCYYNGADWVFNGFTEIDG